jgi:spoIIIJ-associated protein
MNNNPIEEIISFVKDILTKLEIQSDIDVKEVHTDDFGKRIMIDIESPEASVLIGHHGETLNSLQHLLNVFIYKNLGENTVALVDVSGYRKEREKKLIEIAENASEKAKELNKPVVLYPMNSYERKIIHEKITEIEGVRSESEGEEENRRVVIYPADQI